MVPNQKIWLEDMDLIQDSCTCFVKKNIDYNLMSKTEINLINPHVFTLPIHL